MARNKSPLTLRAEYYPMQALLRSLQLLPPAGARHLARGLVRGFLAVLPKRRRLIDEQLAACFPTLSPAERQRLATQSLDHLAEGLLSFARMERMREDEMRSAVSVEGFDHLDEALRQGRGAITFTAHYGSWELMANYVTRVYPRVGMLVRPLDNPLLDRMVTRVRACGGGQIIDSRRVFKDGLRLLRANGILGILVDQNFHKGGVFVDFFGRPAATNTLAPLLARRTGCALLPMHNRQRPGGTHIICEPPVTLSAQPDTSAAIAEDVQTMTKVVERWIREDPAPWLWLHARWKRRPES
jgi:Kdo2-lipid IVA lauroyltransferase/acyltransferase